jgi:hypothetical protein
LLPKNEGQALSKTICRNDVTSMDLDGFTILVRSSKTIQFGQRVHKVPFVRCHLSQLCPVKALLTHLGRAPLDPALPLFSYLNNTVVAGLSHTQFVARLRGLLISLGYNPTHYSAHSLRRGGASLCFRAGMSILQIKQRGDWASNAVEKYVFIDECTAVSAALMMSSAVGP